MRLSHLLTVCSTALAFFSATMFPVSAKAESIAYEITFGTSGSFQHSFLHSATNGMQAGGATYYPGGSKLLSLSGTLSGTWDTGSSTFTASSSLLDGTFAHGATASALASEFGLNQSAVSSATWQVQITSGTVAVAGNGFADGSLDYNLLMTELSGTTTIDSGTFFFDPVNFPSSPNTISQTRVDLWGNNFTTGNRPSAASGDSSLGIDLGGNGSVVVPNPTALMGGLALFGGIAVRRRRDGRSRTQ